LPSPGLLAIYAGRPPQIVQRIKSASRETWLIDAAMGGGILPASEDESKMASPQTQAVKRRYEHCHAIDESGQQTFEPPNSKSLKKAMEHSTAEKNRRGHMKSGFETLNALIPGLNKSAMKISRAFTLRTTIDYCRSLKSENQALSEEAARIKAQISDLERDIDQCQASLPEAGLPLEHAPKSLDEVYSEFVRQRSGNWKFWLFSLIARPMFESFKAVMSATGAESTLASVHKWLAEHCGLAHLRPLALSALRTLSKKTSILTDPKSFPRQSLQQLNEHG